LFSCCYRCRPPVAGTVQQLSVHTVGGVVTPAQALLVVVPADSHLEIEATVLNRDVGFVRAGQDAQIKIDTFNFSRYGLLHGKVLSVSPDAITHNKPQDKSGNDETRDAENATSEPKGRDVEIKTGTRRIISYCSRRWPGTRTTACGNADAAKDAGCENSEARLARLDEPISNDKELA